MGIISNNVIYVDDVSLCDEILERAKNDKIVGIDLESNSIHVYHERISLMQLLILDTVYLVDILKLGLPNQIREILEDEEIEMVFQDMQFDLVLLKKEYNCDTKNIFDISLADKLIVETNESSNMEKLVKRNLNLDVKFSKKQQKSNWAVRPLSERQLKYASKDVIYLIKIKIVQEIILKKDFRYLFLKYFLVNSKPVIRERYYNLNYIYKLKNKYNIKDNDVLSRANQLLISLDEVSAKIDKPCHWIIPDWKIVKIARENPSTLKEFKNIFHTDDKLIHARQTIERVIFFALHNYEVIEFEPEMGISTKRWGYISKSDNNSKYNIENMMKIKEWRSLASKIMKIIPGMIINKKNIPKYSIKLDEIENIIDFPGVIPKYHNILIKDLKQFLVSNTCNISFDIFNK